MDEYEKKIILCPKCHRKIFELNRQYHIIMERKCEKCRQLVVYNPETEEVKLQSIPKRNTASGVVFY